MSTNILQIRPVPKLCPPGLIKELCPLAVSIRFPSKSGARYAFLHFRNSHECETALKQLTGRQLNGKEIKISASRSNNDACKVVESWVKPADRQAGDFNWRQLFVTKLARSTKRFDLAQVFRTASNIRLDTYDDGSCRGTCILKYQSEADALEAFETRHGTVIHGCPIHVNFVLLSKQTKDKQKQTTEQDVEMAEADQTVSN